MNLYQKKMKNETSGIRMSVIYDTKILFAGYIEDLPDYEIYEDGQVFSILSNKYIKFQERNGYLYCSLIKVDENGTRKRTTFAQHQLVARTFIPNPENKKVVNHKDGNGYNNKIENLKWCTHRENSQHAHDTGLTGRGTRPVLQYTTEGVFIQRFDSLKEAAETVNCSHKTIGHVCAGDKKTAKGFVWKFETEKEPFGENEEEIFKSNLNFPGYKMSSLGRVYSTKTNRYMSQVKRKDGYMRVHLNRKSYYVHRLIVKAFHGDAPDNILNPVVNHKDGNKSNNIPDNLEWVEFTDNILHAHNSGLNSTCKPVIRYNLKGEYMCEYDSVADAARDVNVSHTSILQACNKQKYVHTIVDCLWRFKSDPLRFSELDDVGRAKSSVVQYSPDGKIINTFSSMNEAAKETDIHYSSISHNCRGKIKSAGGYIWSYEGEKPVFPNKVGVYVKVDQLSLDGSFVKTWDSISEAAKVLRIQGSHITSVCKGKRNTTGGWKWRLYSENGVS